MGFNGERHIENRHLLKFILAGNCDFVAVSGRTGNKIEYNIRKKDKSNDVYKGVYFLKSKIDSDMKYCGAIYYNEKQEQFIFSTGKNGKASNSNINVKSIMFILNKLNKGNTSLNLRVYHTGKCGRCGRKLTTPESIETGLGPKCSKIVGVERKRVAKKDFG